MVRGASCSPFVGPIAGLHGALHYTLTPRMNVSAARPRRTNALRMKQSLECDQMTAVNSGAPLPAISARDPRRNAPKHCGVNVSGQRAPMKC